METLKIALIGHGHLGKWHAQKIDQNKHVELSFLVESKESLHSELQDLYPKAKLYSSVESLLSSQHKDKNQIDGCIIATPTSLHFEIAKLLLENNINIFCEKPLCHDYKSALSLNRLYEDTFKLNENIVFQVGHSERVHACWEDENLQQHIKETKVIEIDRVAPFKGRATDVSVIQDLMIHDIDILLYQFGFTPIKIIASGQKVISEFYDAVSVHLEDKDGRLAVINASRIDPVEKRCIRMISRQGVSTVNLLTKEFSIPDNQNKGKNLEFKYEGRDHLAIEQQQFYESILYKKKSFCTIEEALEVQEVMQKIEAYLFREDA